MDSGSATMGTDRQHLALLGVQPQECAYTDAYRSLRTRLMALHEQEPFRTVLVTSAMPNEGKTIVCLNLANSLARVEKQVLAVDADLRRPSFHLMLGTPQAAGFVEACQQQAPARDLVRSTNLTGLSIMLAGQSPGHASDVASAPHTETVIRELTQDRHFVLIDSAPVLTDPVTAHLARLVDAVLFVARARGSGAQARRALSVLEDVGAGILGTIVNDVLPEDLAGHGVVYHYQYYGEPSETPAP